MHWALIIDEKLYYWRRVNLFQQWSWHWLIHTTFKSQAKFISITLTGICTSTSTNNYLGNFLCLGLIWRIEISSQGRRHWRSGRMACGSTCSWNPKFSFVRQCLCGVCMAFCQWHSKSLDDRSRFIFLSFPNERIENVKQRKSALLQIPLLSIVQFR